MLIEKVRCYVRLAAMLSLCITIPFCIVYYNQIQKAELNAKKGVLSCMVGPVEVVDRWIWTMKFGLYVYLTASISSMFAAASAHSKIARILNHLLQAGVGLATQI